MEGLEELFDRKLKPIKDDISTLKVDVSTLKTDVSVLKTDVSFLKTDVSVLKTDVSSLKIDVSALKTDVSRLKIDMSSVRTEVSGIKTDLAEVKDVTENRIYKELRQTRNEMKEGFSHMDDVVSAIVLDYNDHEDRIKRVEKHTGSTNN